MKILGICGSPRKGNSYSVLKKLQENNPAIEFNIIRLSRINLDQCRGCYVCVLKGGNKCPIKDDRDLIVKEMMDADGIVISSPVYSLNVTPAMKNFIDRLGFIGHRPRFFNKYAMIISTCSKLGSKDTNEYLRKIFTMFGFNIVSLLGLNFTPGPKDEKQSASNGEDAMAAFNQLIDRIKSKKKNKPTFKLIMMFNIFKTVSILNKDVMEADYEYYKDKGSFFYPRKINFFHNMVAKRMVAKMLSAK